MSALTLPPRGASRRCQYSAVKKPLCCAPTVQEPVVHVACTGEKKRGRKISPYGNSYVVLRYLATADIGSAKGPPFIVAVDIVNVPAFIALPTTALILPIGDYNTVQTMGAWTPEVWTRARHQWLHAMKHKKGAHL